MPIISRTLAPHDTAGLGRTIGILERASEGRPSFTIELESLFYVAHLDIVVAARIRQARNEFVSVSDFAFENANISCMIRNDGDPINQRIPTTEDPPVRLCAANSVSAGVNFDTGQKRMRFTDVNGLQLRTEVGGTMVLADIEQVDVDLTSNKIDVTVSL